MFEKFFRKRISNFKISYFPINNCIQSGFYMKIMAIMHFLYINNEGRQASSSEKWGYFTVMDFNGLPFEIETTPNTHQFLGIPYINCLSDSLEFFWGFIPPTFSTLVFWLKTPNRQVTKLCSVFTCGNPIHKYTSYNITVYRFSPVLFVL